MKNRILIIVSLFIPIFSFSIAPLSFELYNSSKGDAEFAYLFAHGCFAGKSQVFNYAKSYKKDGRGVANDSWIVQEPFATFNFSDANSWDFAWTDLGQAHDMKRLHRAYTMLKAKLPNHKIILVGLSRGARTCLNYLATYKPEGVCALILESPFDSVNTLLASIVKNYISWVPYGKQMLEGIFKKTFSSIHKITTSTLPDMSQFPLSIPVLFVHSAQDKLIPAKSSELLKNALEEQGHRNLHYAKLAAGKHGKALQGSCAADYYKAVHSFYKNYGLPYDNVICQEA